MALLIVSAGAFVATAGLINRTCLLFSPLALVILFFYSLTKRFTALSHFFLGLALGISPIGAWLAVRGGFELPPVCSLRGGAVLGRGIRPDLRDAG